MKKYFKNGISFILFMVIMFSALISMISYYFYLPKYNRYEIKFITSNNNIADIIDKNYIENIKISLEEYREENKIITDDKIKYPYSSFSYINSKKIYKSCKIVNNDQYSIMSIEKRCFNSWQQARRFMKKMIDDISEDVVYINHNDERVTNDSSKDILNSIVYETKSIHVMYLFLIGGIIGLFLGVISLVLINRFNRGFLLVDINYDNINIYKTPFHISYFKSALKETEGLKNIVSITILLSLQLALKFIVLPSGFSNLGLSLTFLVFGTICLIYGPMVGLLVGFLSDILGFMIKPSGIFFIGYTFSAMVSGLIYGLFFYKTRITFIKCFFARVLINIFVNSILGTLWWYLINSRSISFRQYFLYIELPKNLVYLLPQSLLLFYIFKFISPILVKKKLISLEVGQNISFF